MALQRRRRAVPAAAALAVAAACAAVGVGIWSLALSHSLRNERKARRGEARALAILADPRTARFPLHGAPGVLAVTPERDGALAVAHLDAAPRAKTYELWVLRSGAPQPAGIFGGGGRVLVALERKVPLGAEVAVSLERKGGVSHLTGELLFRADAS